MLTAINPSVAIIATINLSHLVAATINSPSHDPLALALKEKGFKNVVVGRSSASFDIESSKSVQIGMLEMEARVLDRYWVEFPPEFVQWQRRLTYTDRFEMLDGYWVGAGSRKKWHAGEKPLQVKLGVPRVVLVETE